MPHPGPEFDAILRGAAHLVDVRAPAEYGKGHVVGAVNIPLFSDDERAEIGTLYKRVGEQHALRRGLDLAGSRLGALVRAFEPFREGGLVVYCARGGMRSRAVVALLNSLGFGAQQLPGGYKAYRNHVLARLEAPLPPRLIVLHGRTGVGKTLLLRRLRNALDLEDLAQHRSSLFGGVNLHPRTQQGFEAALAERLEALDHSLPVWVEGESRKIGDVVMPAALRDAMREATCVLATASLDTRVRRTLDEYGAPDPETIAQLVEALRGLRPFLGGGRVAALGSWIAEGRFAPVVRELLVNHYDPRYDHAMRGYRFALHVDCEDLAAAAATLDAFWERQARGGGFESAPGRSPALARPAAGS